MEICAVMQPTYLPWLGYFDLIANSDVFVIYDTVQFEKQSWQQRNRIRNKVGEVLLTVPVKKGSGLDRKINEVEIDYSRGVLRKHLSTIQQAYSKSRNFKQYFPLISEIYNKEFNYLLDLNLSLIKFGMQVFSIDTKIVFNSDLKVNHSKVEALVAICNKLESKVYYSPVGSKKYIDENNLFPSNDIKLVYQNFEHPRYEQQDQNFISHLSFLDFIFQNDESTIANLFKKRKL